MVLLVLKLLLCPSLVSRQRVCLLQTETKASGRMSQEGRWGRGSLLRYEAPSDSRELEVTLLMRSPAFARMRACRFCALSAASLLCGWLSSDDIVLKSCTECRVVTQLGVIAASIATLLGYEHGLLASIASLFCPTNSHRSPCRSSCLDGQHPPSCSAAPRLYLLIQRGKKLESTVSVPLL